jgi:uncharacterized membrane protein
MKWPVLKAALLLLLLLAFAVRLYDLEGQSFWSDEGLTLYRARLPLAEVMANTITIDGIVTRDTNPPFYFLLVNLWRTAAGESVFALRYVGVLAALLTVPLLYRLGRAVYQNHWVGLGAAWLLAISPFHVWQSQELRNYSLLILFNLISVYGLFRFVYSRHRPGYWLIVWAAGSLLGIYTHYFALFVFAYGLLFLLLFSLRGRPKQLWLGLALIAAVAVPAVLFALARFRAGPQVDFYPVPLLTILHHAASAFSVGVSPSLTHPGWRVWPVVALAAAGLVASIRRRSPTVIALLLSYQLIPLGLLFALSLVNPLYNGTRHLLMGLPPFLMFLAAAPLLSPRAGRLFALLCLAAASVSQLAWLNSQFTAPELIRDDVRSAAYYLNQVAAPEDLVILHDTIIAFTFDYYYEGAAPWITIPQLGELSVEKSIAAMQAAGNQTGRIWYLAEPTPRTGFPRQALSEWAADEWIRLYARRFPAMWLRVNLIAYLSQPAVSTLPASARPLQLSWEENLSLHGIELPAATAGQDWWPIFYWSKNSAEVSGYALSLRLTDQEGNLWAQFDRPLREETSSTGVIVRDDKRFTVPTGLPPGSYQLWLRLLKADQPLNSDSGELDILLAGDMTVQATMPAETAALPDTALTLKASFGREIVLAGYQLPAGPYRPGHLLLLDLYWRVLRPPTADYLLNIQLLSRDGDVLAETTGPPTRADYPTGQWQPDQLLLGRIAVSVPVVEQLSDLTARIALIHPESGEPITVRAGGSLLGQQRLTLAAVQVEPWPAITDLPAIQMPLRATFGEPPLLELHGYDLSGEAVPGGVLSLALVWQAQSLINANYTVFVHLADEGNELIGQGDGQPAQGFRPTNSWRSGEVIVDEHALVIRPDAPPGRYQLWIGFYHPENGQRLPIFLNGSRQPDDRLLLQEVIIP